jgi:hypothetical protein
MMISTDDLRRQLNITGTDDDVLLGDKILAASEWVASYTAIPLDACDIPAPVKEAVRQLAAHLYANREATLVGVTAQSLPFGMLDLLRPYTPFVCG